MGLRNRSFQFLRTFLLFFVGIFLYLHFDLYPITTLKPCPLIPSLFAGILGGLSGAFYVVLKERR